MTAKEKNQHFYQTLFKIAIPIFFSQLLGSLLGIIDTFMVTKLGDDALSAVGIGSQFMFLLSIVLFGLFSGFGIFIAQYYGSKDYDNISKVFYVMLITGLSFALIFLGITQLFPRELLTLFNLNDSPNQQVIEMGIAYLRIIGFSFVTMTVSFAISMLARNVQKVLMPSIFQAVGVLINTGLNYLLIGGNLGFPKMGVSGAAVATLVSSSFVVVLMIGYLYFSKERALKVKLSSLKNMSIALIKKWYKTSIPVLINESFWGLGMTVYLIAYGFIGEKAVGSIYLSNQINSLFWVATISVANASAVMLGNKLGSNDLDTAREWEVRFRKLGVTFGVVLGSILFIFAPVIVPLFGSLSIEVKDMVIMILRIYAVYAPIKFLNAIFIVGTLRSGGDTKFALFAEIFSLWGIGVPLAFALSYFTDLPLYMIILFVNFEEVGKFVLCYRRSASGKWINNLTMES
ncbi:MAG: MATE family efflux transporter [Candidatus Izemoplasmataceae bacterium]